jgi:hypothetical protein
MSRRDTARPSAPSPRLGFFEAAAPERSDFFPLPLAQPHAWTAAILVYELDASTFKGASNYFKGRSTRFAYSGLNLTNGYDANSGPICEVLLSPVEQSAGCPTLCRGDHRATMAKEGHFIKSVENRLTAGGISFRYLSWN